MNADATPSQAARALVERAAQRMTLRGLDPGLQIKLSVAFSLVAIAEALEQAYER